MGNTQWLGSASPQGERGASVTQGGALLVQQRLFAWHAPAVAGERALGANHPMAGHQQAQRVAGAGAGHGAGVAAELLGQFAIAPRLPRRNFAQGLPDPLLEGAAAQLGDDVDPDYWKATDGNAKRALVQLAALAKMRPDAVWAGD